MIKNVITRKLESFCGVQMLMDSVKIKYFTMISHQMLSDAFTNDKTKIIPNLHSLTFIEMYVNVDQHV